MAVILDGPNPLPSSSQRVMLPRQQLTQTPYLIFTAIILELSMLIVLVVLGILSAMLLFVDYHFFLLSFIC